MTGCPAQDKNIISLFHPERLLELQYFVLFDNNIKKIVDISSFAVKEIAKAVEKGMKTVTEIQE